MIRRLKKHAVATRTRLKKTERVLRITTQALQDAHRFLDSIIENIPDMIFVKDAKDLRFVLFNKAGEELLGHKRKHLLGKNDYDLFPKDEADFFTKKDREVLKSGKLLEITEEPIATGEMGLRILHTKKIPILDDLGKPTYLLGISEDITEKTNLQKRIIEESSLAAIGRLVAGIAHEIRNPLFGISSAAQVLSSKVPDDPGLKELSSRMLGEIKRLQRLLNDLLMYARQRKSKPASTNVKELCRSVMMLHESLLTDKQIHVELNFLPKNLMARVDEEQFKQVLHNLCVNAIQASRAGGIIEIESKHSTRNKEWTFKMSNRGDVIKPEYLTQIFEPFFTTRTEGSGLGLAITKKIVQEHGGTIKAESSARNGTTFTIRIPA